MSYNRIIKHDVIFSAVKERFFLCDHCAGRDNVLHLFGPRVHETEPSASDCDEWAVFYFELVAVGIDLLSRL